MMRPLLRLMPLAALLPFCVSLSGCPHAQHQTEAPPPTRFAVDEDPPLDDRETPPKTESRFETPGAEAGRSVVRGPEAVDTKAKDLDPFQTLPVPEEVPLKALIPTAEDPRQEAIERLKAKGANITTSQESGQLAVGLSTADVGDEVFAWLGKIPDVEQVDLSHTQVTDQGLAEMAKLSGLEFLNLSYTKVGDAGLRSLTSLKGLKFLVLNGTKISDEGLILLSEIPSLEGVSLIETQLSPQGIAKLKRRRPDCLVLHERASESAEKDIPPAESKSNSPQAPAEPTEDQAPEPKQAFEQTGWVPQEENPVLAESPGVPQERAADQAVETDASHPPAPLPAEIMSEWSDPDFLATVSGIYMQRGEWEKAIRVLTRAEKFINDNPEIPYQLGIALGQTGDFDASFEKLRQAGGDAAAHYNLGIIIYENAIRQSSEHFRRAVILDPQLAGARAWLNHLNPKAAKTFQPEIIPANGETSKGQPDRIPRPLTPSKEQRWATWPDPEF